MAIISCTLIVDCNHTPESIDRIILPIRKRGLKVSQLSYEEKPNNLAQCTMSFAIEEADLMRVYNNLIRQSDVLKVEKV
jgi:hypothetical protein